MNKKITLLFVLFALFANCIWAADKPKIVATTTIIADITRQIAEDLVEIKSLVPVGGDPHLYEPVPQDAILIVNANLILKNGFTLEGWLNEFIENSGTKAVVSTVTEGIAPIQSSVYANSPDPHAWMDAENGIVYAENIKNALVGLDPANAVVYETNCDAFKLKLTALNEEIKAMILTIPEGKRVLITSHDAFKYYGRKYGLQLESILGTSTDAQAQTSDINRLYQVIKATKVPAIFIESTINPQKLMQIAKDTKIKIGGKLYADSLGEPDGEAGTYEKMLRYNTQTIVNGLTGKGELTAEERTTGTGIGMSGGSFLLYVLGGLLVGALWFFVRRKQNR